MTAAYPILIQKYAAFFVKVEKLIENANSHMNSVRQNNENVMLIGDLVFCLYTKRPRMPITIDAMNGNIEYGFIYILCSPLKNTFVSFCTTIQNN